VIDYAVKVLTLSCPGICLPERCLVHKIELLLLWFWGQRRLIWFLVEGRGKGLVNYLQLVGIHGISISQI